MIVNGLPHEISFRLNLPAAMLPTSIAYYLLCTATAASLILVAAVMAWRKSYRELPFFFSYVVFHVCCSSILWFMYHCGTYAQYFWAYYAARIINTILELLVIHEVLDNVFKTYETLRNIGLNVFQWITLVLVALAVITAAAAPGVDADRIMAGILVGERSVLVVQASLLVLLFLLASFFGFSWKAHIFGVAAGFGVLASVQLAALSIRTEQGPAAGNVFGLLLQAAETCAAIIWAAYFLFPERKQICDKLPKTNLEDWNRSLSELLNR